MVDNSRIYKRIDMYLLRFKRINILFNYYYTIKIKTKELN